MLTHYSYCSDKRLSAVTEWRYHRVCIDRLMPYDLEQGQGYSLEQGIQWAYNPTHPENGHIIIAIVVG